jgi:hypothetical protein
MSRSLSPKSLKVRCSGSDEDSKAIKMRVPQKIREFFAEGIPSVGMYMGYIPFSPSVETVSFKTISETV